MRMYVALISIVCLAGCGSGDSPPVPPVTTPASGTVLPSTAVNAPSSPAPTVTPRSVFTRQNGCSVFDLNDMIRRTGASAPKNDNGKLYDAPEGYGQLCHFSYLNPTEEVEGDYPYWEMIFARSLSVDEAQAACKFTGLSPAEEKRLVKFYTVEGGTMFTHSSPPLQIGTMCVGDYVTSMAINYVDSWQETTTVEVLRSIAARING